jgi:diaminohydroxyphosphoribosylaminopyrimidine deaminase / 5-amino-6-(5-phosphoribosylamino)uracil reductase
LTDDPQLTSRLPGLEHRSPVRIVIDRNLRLPPTLRLFTEADRAPTWVATLAATAPERQVRLAACGIKIITAEPDAARGGIDLGALLRGLGDEGLTRLLVEGGGQLAASLLRFDLVDRLVWMRAPLVIGNDGLPGVAALDLAALAAAPRFSLMSSETAGGDVIETYRRAD